MANDFVDAVAMMDKLRTADTVESEQTHDSLRRYLLEETTIADAVRSGSVDQLREELAISCRRSSSRPDQAGGCVAIAVHHRRRRRHTGCESWQSGARMKRRTK